MSVFSGKCDFYDSFCMIDGDGDVDKVIEKLKETTIYVLTQDGRHHKIKSDTIKDIAKYYPYLVAISYGSKNDGSVYILASRPYIDRQEDESKEWRAEEIFRYWRKCKRNKIPFVAEECLKEMFCNNDETLKEMVERVVEYGDKADFSDIHTWMGEYDRRTWFDELVNVGYTEREAYNWAFNALFDKPEVIEKRLGRMIKE